jgi:hypothetical protein
MPHGWFDAAVGRYDERSIAVANETRLPIGELQFRPTAPTFAFKKTHLTIPGVYGRTPLANFMFADPQLERQT